MSDLGQSGGSAQPIIDGRSELPNARRAEWYTPPAIFAALGLRFDLDPCCPPGGLPWIPTDHFYAPPVDGLTQSWFGRVWLNPPYGIPNHAWVDRLAEHGNGIALVFARTDSGWWHRAARSSQAICFLSRRLVFVDRSGRPASNNGGAPSTLIAWGDGCATALRLAGLGLVWMREGCDA
jgi:hypothetical protein